MQPTHHPLEAPRREYVESINSSLETAGCPTRFFAYGSTNAKSDEFDIISLPPCVRLWKRGVESDHIVGIHASMMFDPIRDEVVVEPILGVGDPLGFVEKDLTPKKVSLARSIDTSSNYFNNKCIFQLPFVNVVKDGYLATKEDASDIPCVVPGTRYTLIAKLILNDEVFGYIALRETACFFKQIAKASVRIEKCEIVEEKDRASVHITFDDNVRDVREMKIDYCKCMCDVTEVMGLDRVQATLFFGISFEHARWQAFERDGFLRLSTKEHRDISAKKILLYMDACVKDFKKYIVSSALKITHNKEKLDIDCFCQMVMLKSAKKGIIVSVSRKESNGFLSHRSILINCVTRRSLDVAIEVTLYDINENDGDKKPHDCFILGSPVVRSKDGRTIPIGVFSYPHAETAFLRRSLPKMCDVMADMMAYLSERADRLSDTMVEDRT